MSRIEIFIIQLENNDPTLTSLNSNYTKLTLEQVQRIAKALAVNTSLIKLSLSWNRIGDEVAKAFADVLTINTSLTELILNHKEMQDYLKLIRIIFF